MPKKSDSINEPTAICYRGRFYQQKGVTDEHKNQQKDWEGRRIHRRVGRDIATGRVYVEGAGGASGAASGGACSGCGPNRRLTDRAR